MSGLIPALLPIGWPDRFRLVGRSRPEGKVRNLACSYYGCMVSLLDLLHRPSD